MLQRVGILKFEDRNRYGPNGIPSSVLFGGGKLLVVNCKSPHKRNHWAKLSVPATFEEGAKNQSQKGELVELLGRAGCDAEPEEADARLMSNVCQGTRVSKRGASPGLRWGGWLQRKGSMIVSHLHGV